MHIVSFPCVSRYASVWPAAADLTLGELEQELKRMAKATSGWSDDFIVEARRLYRKSWFKVMMRATT